MFGRHRASHKAYERYQDKPICEEWHNYGNFMKWARANGYRDDLTIDRVKNDRGYSPDNCRWSTEAEQARNRKDNLPPIHAFGEAKTPIAWSEDPRCAVTYALLHKRLKAGWPIELALQTPSQHGNQRKVGFALGGLRPKGSSAPNPPFKRG